MKKLTITIVNYNAGKHLINCLDSLEKIKNELDFEVFVIDNASVDGSIEEAEKKFKHFKFIKNKENLGFGKAHNLVLKKSQTPYLLTLNPDCIIPSGTLKYIFDYMEKHPEVGLSSSKVEKENGEIDKASHRGFPTPKASFLYYVLKDDSLYHLSKLDMNVTHEVDSVVGAFMFIRRDVLEEVGYFDEDYFLYAEDLDLCYRIKNKGKKIMYIPEVKIMHVKGASSGIKSHSSSQSNADEKTKKSSVDYFYSTMKIFYKKHYENKYPFIVNWIVYSGINLKWVIAKRKKKV